MNEQFNSTKWTKHVTSKNYFLDICWKTVSEMKAITGKEFEPDICRLKFRKISTLWTAGF